jgi:hypothetical protein
LFQDAVLPEQVIRFLVVDQQCLYQFVGYALVSTIICPPILRVT